MKLNKIKSSLSDEKIFKKMFYTYLILNNEKGK